MNISGRVRIITIKEVTSIVLMLIIIKVSILSGNVLFGDFLFSSTIVQVYFIITNKSETFFDSKMVGNLVFIGYPIQLIFG